MAKLFSQPFFRRSRLLAAALLTAFLAQALWLVHAELHPGTPEAIGDISPESARFTSGWRQLHGGLTAGAPFPDAPGSLPSAIPVDAANFATEHSPLLAILSAALPSAANRNSSEKSWRWQSRIPFLAFGVFLGASLWYVARRLCGSTGGFLALTLYCFSPSMLQASAAWHTEPEILAAWGSFGGIFTAIAVSHTLYAPREVVLWNWRRVVLLGVALAIAVGSQFSMIVVIPLALGLMLYLAPIRRAAAFTIWVAACVVGWLLLFAAYFFRLNVFLAGLRHAAFFPIDPRNFVVLASYRQAISHILRACPAFVLFLPAAVAVYAAWPRTRYFGNTAPLLVALIFLVLGIAHPLTGSSGFFLASVPFLFLFIAGVLADLMETPSRPLITACVWSLAGASVVWSLLALIRIPHG